MRAILLFLWVFKQLGCDGIGCLWDHELLDTWHDKRQCCRFMASDLELLGRLKKYLCD